MHHAWQARSRKTHKYRYHKEVAHQQDHQLVNVKIGDKFDLVK